MRAARGAAACASQRGRDVHLILLLPAAARGQSIRICPTAPLAQDDRKLVSDDDDDDADDDDGDDDDDEDEDEYD